MLNPNCVHFLTLLISLLSLPSPTISQSSSLTNFLHCLRYGSDPIVSQSIYIASNPAFQTILQARIKNRRFLNPETQKPVAIVVPTLIDHVQGTVICAKDNGLQIRIRSGGHDYEGLSYRSNVTFIILDMANFRSIDIDIKTETAWVQSGATLGELYYHIANKTNMHGFPSGVCPTVGIGGHFSGGGYGNLMRKYGLSVDNILDIIAVDALGNVHDRASMGEDLFWAIRGGGGASFAVVVSYKIKLVRVPNKVTVFRKGFTLEQGATDLVHKWQQIAPNINEELFIRVKLEPSFINGNQTVTATFIGFFLGRREKLLPIISKTFPELNLTQQDCHEMRWVETTLFWAGFPIGTPIETLLNRTLWTPLFFKNKSDYVKNVIPKESLNKIWKMTMAMMDRNDINKTRFDLECSPYGGKMNVIPESNTPFPHRKGNLFLIQYAFSWIDEGNNVSFNNIEKLRKLYDGMAPYVSKDPRECFLNYRDLDIGSSRSNETSFDDAKIYGRKYFKDNYTRLTKVKASVDPNDFFKYEQSIPPIN
ncbi:hypothetical protein J1N35_039552 [Gossypium stocksii]|uniref:FAD-binding PCMH-type domain-containing protein n=1 Tax=Gossypium stocksii TaxID=47602 RepID=A0A9D3ZNP9_9ROSI|nr:hypothetical protein J1N35_039552 [Gossypium stocksii]